MTLSNELLLGGALCVIGLPLMFLLLIAAVAFRVIQGQRPTNTQPAAPTPAPQAAAAPPPASHVVIEHRGLAQPAPQAEPSAAAAPHVQAFEVVLPGSFTATLRPKE